MVTEYFYPHLGGVTEHVHYLSRELRRAGHEVDIITSAIGDAPPQRQVVRLGRSIPVYSNGSMARFTYSRRLRDEVRGVLRDGRYDLVHVHCPLNPSLPLAAIHTAEVPVVGTVHTWFPASITYRMGRAFFQRTLDRLDVAIAVSCSAVEAHARYFKADWQVIPNGVDLEEFNPGVPAPPSMASDAPHILFVGRFDPRNALGTLLDAFPLVKRDIPDARLVVVGDGPLRRHYARRAARDPSIHFTGALTDQRAAHYAAASVYACPTTRASFGVTLLEAMACGTPIVCSDLEAFRAVVTPGREALAAPAGDHRAFAGVLSQVLGDAELRSLMRHRALERVRHFAWPVVARQVLDAYARTGVMRSVAAA